MFHELPEDSFEAFLSVPIPSRGRVVGVINLQHRQPHTHTRRQMRLISMIGFLVGAEIEMARLEVENSQLHQLETRKLLERAKGILQRDLRLDEEQAYLTLQTQARQKRKSLKEIAESRGAGRGNPAQLRDQLKERVRRLIAKQQRRSSGLVGELGSRLRPHDSNCLSSEFNGQWDNRRYNSAKAGVLLFDSVHYALGSVLPSLRQLSRVIAGIGSNKSR
jgi:GAF domain-containing protein